MASRAVNSVATYLRRSSPIYAGLFVLGLLGAWLAAAFAPAPSPDSGEMPPAFALSVQVAGLGLVLLLFNAVVLALLRWRQRAHRR